MARPKRPMVKQELTVDEQIAKIQQEAQQKIKELRNSLSWNERFKSAFNSYVKNNHHDLSTYLQGRNPETSIITEINIHLADVNLKVKYHSSTFDNEMYAKSGVNDLIDCYDLSEYPVYTILSVTDLKGELQGYVRVNCNYSSYNGNEYSSWIFVKMQEITCKVFTPYQP